jgi:hypothetical protein
MIVIILLLIIGFLVFNNNHENFTSKLFDNRVKDDYDITIVDMKDNVIATYDSIGSIDWESIYTVYGREDYMILYSDGSTEKQYYDRYVIKNKFPKY